MICYDTNSKSDQKILLSLSFDKACLNNDETETRLVRDSSSFSKIAKFESVRLNSRMYTQIHTPIVIRGGEEGGGGEEGDLIAVFLNELCLQWKAIE